MSTDYSPAVWRFSGFAQLYDRFRPEPPEELHKVISRLAELDTLNLVADVGCGTGLSTRFWAEHAKQVTGIDPSEDMLGQARIATWAPNIQYKVGYGYATGLADLCADVVTISQAFHWMEPQTTLKEVHRILRPGGVLAVYDQGGLPILANWQADAIMNGFYEAASALPQMDQAESGLARWPKDTHYKNIQQYGHFRYTCEFTLSYTRKSTVDYLVGGLMSHGQIQSLLKVGVTEAELKVPELIANLTRLLGTGEFEWLMNAQVIACVK